MKTRTNKADLNLKEEIRLLKFQTLSLMKDVEVLEGVIEEQSQTLSETVDVIVNVFLDMLVENSNSTNPEDREKLRNRFLELQKKWMSPS